MSREITKEEFKQQFLEKLNSTANYWLELNDKSLKEIVDGIIFSVLVAFDGGTELPAMDIVVRPHPEDKQYCIDNDENYYKDEMALDDGDLHEKWAMEYMRTRK